MTGNSSISRRSIVRSAVLAGVAPSFFPQSTDAMSMRSVNMLNAQSDFNARGDGKADDTEALQRALRQASEEVRPLLLPSGAYRITRPLKISTNCMLLGSAFGTGFNCRIEPYECAAFVIGGKDAAFHSIISDLLVWPKGGRCEFVCSIDNSYSITVRNLRIHNAPTALAKAAVMLLGDTRSGGHGACNNICWDNLIVRNDEGQPPSALYAASGCGSHTFINPDLENYRVLFDWRGGQIEMFSPYTERAGAYGVNCDPDPADQNAKMNIFGGRIAAEKSGIACGLRGVGKGFNSFGTTWSSGSDHHIHFYAVPEVPAVFEGLDIDRKISISGVDGWQKGLSLPSHRLRGRKNLELTLRPGSEVELQEKLLGADPLGHEASAWLSNNDSGLSVSAWVDATDSVSLRLTNRTDQTRSIAGSVDIVCKWRW